MVDWYRQGNAFFQVREFAGKDKLVLAGSGCESTRQTIELTRAMAWEGGAARQGQLASFSLVRGDC